MLKKEKYHGEIWFPEKEDKRCFCVLTYSKEEVLLETNLVRDILDYKHQLILGVFTGLGHLTFLDNEIHLVSGGIINSAIYKPKYAFVFAEHFIDPINLKFQNFIVSNNELIDWIEPRYNHDFKNKTVKIPEEKINSFRIDEIGLTIELGYSTSYKLGNEELVFKNTGYLKFKSDSQIKLIEAIEYYNKIQKLIQFITGRTKQFIDFNFQCVECENWGSVYFKDKAFKDSRFTYFSMNFEGVLPKLTALIKLLYLNKDFHFCVSKLLDNHIEGQLSHSKRFTNSISSLEAYSKLFGHHKNTKLSSFLIKNKELLISAGRITEEKINEFISKIIRSRDYHVHSNTNNVDVFSDFELLYISFLLDIVVAIELLKKIEIPKNEIEKIIYQARSVFNDMQNVNKILSQDSLIIN